MRGDFPQRPGSQSRDGCRHEDCGGMKLKCLQDDGVGLVEMHSLNDFLPYKLSVCFFGGPLSAIWLGMIETEVKAAGTPGLTGCRRKLEVVIFELNLPGLLGVCHAVPPTSPRLYSALFELLLPGESCPRGPQLPAPPAQALVAGAKQGEHRVTLTLVAGATGCRPQDGLSIVMVCVAEGR
jgi:hypothetical protein